MALLDKLLAAFKPKQKPAEEAAPEQTPVAEQPAKQEAQAEPEVAQEVDPAVIAEMQSRLVEFVYDDELASELAPAFVAMSAVEGFDKVMELFAAKEKQIEALNVGGQEQKSTPAVQEKPEEEQPKTPSATDILRQRATAQRK